MLHKDNLIVFSSIAERLLQRTPTKDCFRDLKIYADFIRFYIFTFKERGSQFSSVLSRGESMKIKDSKHLLVIY